MIIYSSIEKSSDDGGYLTSIGGIDWIKGEKSSDIYDKDKNATPYEGDGFGAFYNTGSYSHSYNYGHSVITMTSSGGAWTILEGGV